MVVCVAIATAAFGAQWAVVQLFGQLFKYMGSLQLVGAAACFCKVVGFTAEAPCSPKPRREGQLGNPPAPQGSTAQGVAA